MQETINPRICVPICVGHLSEILPAIERASQYADIIELRLDCLVTENFAEVTRSLGAIRNMASCPVIFTLRPVTEGGRSNLEERARFNFWHAAGLEMLKSDQLYADFEIDVAAAIMSSSAALPVMDWARVICSYHDLKGVPTDLEKIYERMAATRARILKIAVQAQEVTDCLPILNLLANGRRDGRDMIAIAMGHPGILTRILGPSRGAFLTYGSLDEDNSTAPGQIGAAELIELYRIRAINEKTEIMGLVGENIMHSISPHMHNAAFAASSQNAIYIPFEVRGIDDFVRRMVHPRTRELDWNLRGLSITAPHKISIMQHLDWVDPIAVEIGAVNTVIVEGGELMGYNTDAEAAIAPLHGLIDLDRARLAVIGAGGAARALLRSLRNAGAHVTVFARDVERGKLVAKQFDAEFTSLAGASFGEFEIVVNATPLGTRGLCEDDSPATASQLRGAKIAYDLVYNPIETRFMREASEAGCQCIGGVQMLVAQAAEQFALWSGRDAPVEVMREAALKALRSNE